jgi:hypothetical protein
MYSSHRRAEPEAVLQAEPRDPALDVGQDVRLHGACHRYVTHRPVDGADLDVLPGRQPAPQAPHGRLRVEHPRVQAGAPGKVQVNEAGQAGADDGDVEGGGCVHAAAIVGQQAPAGHRCPHASGSAASCQAASSRTGSGA